MDLISIILIAIGLAMDCFAIATAKGIAKKRFDKLFTLKISLLFGVFQGGMFWLSCAVCSHFADFNGIATLFDKADHWVAFLLLLCIGIKMMLDEFRQKPNACETKNNTQKPENEMLTLLSLAVAVSIDAFVTGIIFVEHPQFILPATLIIGIVSLIFTLLGLFVGVKFGSRFKIKAELIGGIILILIGIKILAEHLLS